jgi:hypothetical protein
MSRLVIPVSHRTLWATADEKLWNEIHLLLRDGAGNWQRRLFRLDNGTEISTFPAWDAKRLGLVVPSRPAAVRHEQTGLEVRSGMLRFRIVGMDQTDYAVSCLLLGDPNVRPSPNAPRGTIAHNLLQPLALLQGLRFTMEKDDTGQNRYGQLVVETV